MTDVAFYIGKKRRPVTVERLRQIKADRAAGKANCQAVFFSIGDARKKAKQNGIVGDDNGELVKRML